MASDDPSAPEGRAEVPASPDRPSFGDGPAFGDRPAGATAEAGRSRVGRRTVAAVAVAVGLAAAGGVAIAATGGSTGIGNATIGHPGAYGYGYGGEGRPGGDQGGPGMPGGRGGVGGALHGEFVVPDGSGGYATRLLQSGRITAVDGDRLTVASDDGYSKTYTVTSTTTFRGIASAADLEVDATVTVLADQDAAALTIGDRSAAPDGDRGRGGPDGPGGKGGRGGMPPGQSGQDEGGTPPGSSQPGEPSSPQPTT